ncbi:MAG: hypothetical protein J6V04_04555 [Bacteroidales bacterium]|nr:hypothetical protein [Bacteroidales bacterium]
MNFESYSEDYALFAKKRGEQAGILQAVGNVLIGDVKEDDIPFIKEFKCVKEFLELPINDKRETFLKKIFATVVIIAKEKGQLPFDLPESVEEIASMVDDALTRIKVAFKQQMKEMDIYEAADALVDRIEARTIALVERVVEVGLPVLTEKLAALAMAHPYTKPLAPVIKMVAPYVAEPVKNAICKGVRFLAEKSKPIIHKAIETAVAAGTKVIDMAKSKLLRKLVIS